MIFRPDVYIASYNDLDVQKLQNKKIKVLIVDIDNTLVASSGWDLDDQAKDFVARLKKMEIIPVVISNNINKRVAHFAQILQIDYYAFSLKPLPWRFYQLQKKYHVKKEEVMIMGDQLLTDVFFAKTSGIKCILVDPLEDKDNIFGTVTRSIEKIIRKIDKFEKGAYYDKM
ncbi:MAG: YqeG family HAD IIIA-type phosphatase [Erysipelotrichaceae bacterium]|nr:YqeG family HAD IIIA-type phosphatase [Erysipelotrichaceae bacterium]MDY5252494.1 YqeG family HAD IIIA-type phosphatase [Erysipelotrichaceae bacterium]